MSRELRYRITAWHGEGRSVFYVVDAYAPFQERPALVASYIIRENAEHEAARLNALDALPLVLEDAQ